MSKIILVLLVVFCASVFSGSLDRRSDYIDDYGSYGESWVASSSKWGSGEKYPGIWIRERDVKGGDDDKLQGSIQEFKNDNDKLGNANKYLNGIRIGVDGNVDNRFGGYDGDRNGVSVRSQVDLRSELLLNAGLQAGLDLNAGLGINTGLGLNAGLRAGLRAGLGLNSGLRAALGLNAGLSLGAAAGLSLGAGLRVGLDLSAGAELDKQEDLVRPCQKEDYQCIRKFFAENSQCTPSYGPSPDPLYLDQNTLSLANANLSLTLTNLKITGLASATISDLYINKVTGNVVLSIQIGALNQTSPKAYVSYKRFGKEPIILADVSTILLSNLRLTVVLPRVPNLRLELADITASVDSNINLSIGAAASTSTDPEVTSSYLQLSANLGLSIKESLLLQAQLFAALFIQLNICDFGVNLISI